MPMHLVRKYTGHTISAHEIAHARRQGTTAAAIATAIADTCHALAATEANLTQCAGTLATDLDEVRRALAAGPSDPTPTPNPTGRLQTHGPRLDALTAQRATHITHLRALARIWLAHHTPTTSTASQAEQMRRYAATILAAIDNDIREGTVPTGIGSYVDLHRYLDANDYLIATGVPYDVTQASIDLIAALQGLVVARLRQGDRPYCTHDTCAFPTHDHTTAYDPDGHDLSKAQPMRCRHCGQPAHYDARLDDYRHDDPATPDCFLIHRDD
ncbi:hypothetical protein M8I35_04325 [Micromonospora sp. MSM11]|nr:hypothetical protein [Micromonospora sp. MSM11]MCL7456403.1 hypothetical protein [Micromonospora sp. MSM11]